MAKMKIGFSASVVDDIITYRALISMGSVCWRLLGLKTIIDAHREDGHYVDDLFIECDESEVDHIRWLWTKLCDTKHEKEAIREQVKYTRSLIGDDKYEES